MSGEGRKLKTPKKLHILYRFPLDLNYLPPFIHRKEVMSRAFSDLCT